MQSQTVETVTVVEMVVRVPVIDIGAPVEVMPVEAVGARHISRASLFKECAAMIGAFHNDAPTAVQALMDIHSPANIVHVAHPAVRTDADRAAIPSDILPASS